uniref:Uncharacterized protein n=1 Tax=Amphimedon queenslandica TaxID=400682 RepID=A0A1X7T2N3_AMPQE
MSLKDVLDKLDNISDRVDKLTTDVSNLKDKNKALELDRTQRDAAVDRSRCSRSRSPISSTGQTPHSPYDRISEYFSDEDDPERTQGAYKLPRVEATTTPWVDQVIKPLAYQLAKMADRELARLQMFVFDLLAPVSSLTERVSTVIGGGEDILPHPFEEFANGPNFGRVEGDQNYETNLNLSPDSSEELIWWDTQMIT